MARINLGTQTTNSQGRAIFSISEGSGKQKVLSVLDSDKSVNCETEIIHSLFYDEGTSGTPYDEWWKSSNLSLTSTNDGLIASNSSSSTYYLAPNIPGTSKSSMNDLYEWNDFICEFTYVSHTGTVTIQTRNANANTTTRILNAFTLTNGDTIKITYTNGTVTYYLNGTQMNFTDSNTGDVMLRFSIANGNFVFKDFVIYSMEGV